MFLHNTKGETIVNFFLRASGALRLCDMQWHDDTHPPRLPPSTAERPRDLIFLANTKGEIMANFFLMTMSETRIWSSG